jgi:hypothetical protein
MMGVSDCSSSTTLSTMVAEHVHDHYECDPLEALDVCNPVIFFLSKTEKMFAPLRGRKNEDGLALLQ